MPLHETLVPYTSAGGVPIALVHDGLVPAETMLHHAQSSLVRPISRPCTVIVA